MKKPLIISFIVGVSLFTSLLFLAYSTYSFLLSFFSKWPLMSVVSAHGQEKEAYKHALHEANRQGYFYSVCCLILSLGFGIAAKGVSDLKKWGIQILIYLMTIITFIGGNWFYSNYVDLSELNDLFDRDALVSFLFWVFLPGLLAFCLNNSDFKKNLNN